MATFERATVGLFLWWSASLALIDNPGRALSISRFDVTETAERIESGARSRGLKVLDRTDYAAIAKREGYRLRPTQSLLVDAASGGEPVRLVIWQTRDGITMVSAGERVNEDPRMSDPALPNLLQVIAPVAVTVIALS
jgi:uncharacterized protein (DUF302 family)